jgi:hypothetical protein
MKAEGVVTSMLRTFCSVTREAVSVTTGPP